MQNPGFKPQHHKVRILKRKENKKGKEEKGKRRKKEKGKRKEKNKEKKYFRSQRENNLPTYRGAKIRTGSNFSKSTQSR